MNKTTMTFAMAIVLAAVFAITSPVDMATAQPSDAMPDGEGEYKDGEHKEGKVCPVTGKTLQFLEQFY